MKRIKGTVIWSSAKEGLQSVFNKALKAPKYMFWLAKLFGKTQVAIDSSADGTWKMESKRLWGKTYIMSFDNITEGSNGEGT
jgi:hypothetical protein